MTDFALRAFSGKPCLDSHSLRRRTHFGSEEGGGNVTELNAKDAKGNTALQLAEKTGKKEAVELLRKAGGQ